MSADTPWTLAKALIQISSPDSPSKPARNECSLFIRRNSPELELSELESSDEEIKSYSRNSNVSKSANPSLPNHVNTNNNNNNNNTSVHKTPPRRRKYSKTSWYNRTDPGRGKIRSRLNDKDSKKRRVSFFPSLKIQEYAEKEPYMVPLDDPSIIPVHTQWKYNENPLSTAVANNPSSPDSSFSIRDPGTPEGGTPEHPRASLSSVYTVGIDNTGVRNSSLEIPDFIKEQLLNIVRKDSAYSNSNKTVITEYATLITPKKLTPIKRKMVYPPNALDPIHHALKPHSRNKGDKIQLSLDRDGSIIPISYLKKLLSKHTNHDFIPASLSTWLQVYSTKVTEHLVKLIYAQSKKDKSGTAHATPRDAILVMKKYLGLDQCIIQLSRDTLLISIP